MTILFCFCLFSSQRLQRLPLFQPEVGEERGDAAKANAVREDERPTSPSTEEFRSPVDESEVNIFNFSLA